MPEWFEYCEFLGATQQSGRYALFTCSCGIFGCGGYWVDVECTEDAWVLRNGFAPYDADEPEEQVLIFAFEYRIPWEQVVAAIAQIRAALLILLSRMPDRRAAELPCWRAYLEHA